MIIDEDELAAAKMAETLEPIAGVTTRFANCAEALASLDDDIELVIASLSVGGGDPLRLITQCRANEALRQLPILMIADDNDLPRLAKGLDLGANDYLVRPVDRNELLARTVSQIRRKRLQDRLSDNYRRSLSLALTDELTGLYNRRYLFAHLDELMARANRDAFGIAILLFDIDHFKAVNDTHGHAAGDEVLRELAARTIGCVRSVDLVARLGGEEFVVVMPEIDLAIATAVGERLRQAVAMKPFSLKVSGEALHMTISIGAAAATAGGDTRDQLLKRADDALYRAKTSGRNRIAVNPSDPSHLLWPLPPEYAAKSEHPLGGVRS